MSNLRTLVTATLSGAVIAAVGYWQAGTPQPLTVSKTGENSPAAKDVSIEDREKPTQADPKVIYRPTSVPDRIILTWCGDPAKTQAVTWRTDATVKKAIAELAIADGGPLFIKQSAVHPAESTFLESDLSEALYHTVRFENLSPRTKYAYRVGDGVNWSEWSHFTTAGDRPEPFSFVYFGDAQNDIKSLWSRVIREAYSDAPKARFMIHAGDLVSNSEKDVEWAEWFYAGGWLNATLPSVPTPGNHEYIRDKENLIAPRLTKHWRPQFALPENGPTGLEETAYFLDYQGCRIISLNSNVQQDQQTEWLGRVLADNPNTWTVVTLHHPIYSSAKNRDNAKLRAAWKPIFDKFRVDLVLQGHDHTYARTGFDVPVNVAEGVNTASTEGGTVYVVSVSGPKMYNLTSQPFMKRSAEDTQLYQIIRIDGRTLRYEARTAVGDVYDAFTLTKRNGQKNELVEQVPSSPERRRPPAPVKANEDVKAKAAG